jgi:hypothetical protein
MFSLQPPRHISTLPLSGSSRQRSRTSAMEANRTVDTNSPRHSSFLAVKIVAPDRLGVLQFHWSVGPFPCSSKPASSRQVKRHDLKWLSGPGTSRTRLNSANGTPSKEAIAMVFDEIEKTRQLASQDPYSPRSECPLIWSRARVLRGILFRSRA